MATITLMVSGLILIPLVEAIVFPLVDPAEKLMSSLMGPGYFGVWFGCGALSIYSLAVKSPRTHFQMATRIVTPLFAHVVILCVGTFIYNTNLMAQAIIPLTAGVVVLFVCRGKCTCGTDRVDVSGTETSPNTDSGE